MKHNFFSCGLRLLELTLENRFFTLHTMKSVISTVDIFVLMLEKNEQPYTSSTCSVVVRTTEI